MGVSGCGKSSLGAELARVLDLPLIEGDDFHPPANVGKMTAGIPLTDADREGWLDTLGAQLAQHGEGAVLTCSALK
ncbi:MAG: gluconokinase, partial [Comamonadaceae bacterium]